MAIKKVKVTDDFLTLWVNPKSNVISVRRNDGKPLEEINYIADDLYDFYKHLMNDPASVNPKLEKMILQEDCFDGSIITITVQPCGHYTVHRKKLKKPSKSPLWKFFCH
jgi:hypothetical protein